MAWVFRVNDPELFDAPRALKLLKPEAAEGEEYERFLAEAQILATIQHPNLIHVYDFGQDADTGCHFYTMDYIEGRTLAALSPDWLDDDEDDEEEEEGSDPEAVPEEAEVDPNATTFIQVQRAPVITHYTVRDVCEYFSDVLAALARLHRENVVHRDIKPENIFLTFDGIAILGDLGIAKGRHSSRISESGRVPGTPLYMSPEHTVGDPATVRSDVFSLGLSLFAVLSGETVYHQIEGVDAGDSHSVLRHLLQLNTDGGEFEFIFHDSIPDAVCDVIEKACAIQQSDRYQTADDFNQALRDAIEGVSQTGKGGIRPLVAAAIAVPILALAGYFGMQVISLDDREIETQQALKDARDRAIEAEKERRSEEARVAEQFQKIRDSEGAAKDRLQALEAELEHAKNTVDTVAINAAALKLAQERATQAVADRRVEDLKIEAERSKALERQRQAELQLASMQKQLEEAQKERERVTLAAAAAAAAVRDGPVGENPGLIKAMAQYEKAYESRSIEDLNRVWSMSRFERTQIQRLFDDCGRIKVTVDITESEVNGSTARVDYDEAIFMTNCETTPEIPRQSELTASLARRGDEWQIKQIRNR